MTEIYKVTEWDEDEGTVVRALCPDEETAVAFIERVYGPEGYVETVNTGPGYTYESWRAPWASGREYTIDAQSVEPSVKASV